MMSLYNENKLQLHIIWVNLANLILCEKKTMTLKNIYRIIPLMNL